MVSEKSYKINYFDELDSTNNYALSNIANLSDKEVILAEKQVNGKGRFERSWISNKPDNIYLSIVLKPAEKVSQDQPLVNLTQYMSVVICKTLEDYGVSATIKWPNDVLVDDKKIAGILSQVSVQGDNLKGFVLGTGINLNLSDEDTDEIDQPATSLSQILDKPVHRDSFIEKLLDNFFEGYDLFWAKGFQLIKHEYTKRIKFIEKQVAVRDNGDIICL